MSHTTTIQDEQRAHLDAVVDWAQKIHTHLGALQRANSSVHFRPGARGVSMVGLLPERPQRGKSNLRDLPRLAQELEAQFARHCRDVPRGRATPEKRLQSYLVSDAYAHDRRMDSLERAAAAAGEPLVFVTDEIVIRPLEPDGIGKIVCDLLALRGAQGGERRARLARTRHRADADELQRLAASDTSRRRTNVPPSSVANHSSLSVAAISRWRQGG